MIKKFNNVSLLFCLILLPLISIAQKVMVAGTPTMKDDFPKKIGNLRLAVNFIRLHKIMTNEIKTDSVKIMNAWDKKMTLSFPHLPSYLKMKVEPAELSPNETGIIVCTFDGSKRNDWGYFIDRVQLITNDTLLPKKTISITATIEEYFPPMTMDDSASAARLILSEDKFNMGKRNPAEKMNHDFVLTNEGKKPLVLHKAKSNSSSVALHLEKNLLQPGESAKLTVNIDATEKTGNDSSTVTVISSDPFRPVVTLTIEYEIEK